MQLDEGRFGAWSLKWAGSMSFSAKKGGTAEVNLSSLVARDEGFYFLYIIMEGL